MSRRKGNSVGSLAEFRNRLRGGAGWRTLSDARARLNPSDYDAALSWIATFRHDLSLNSFYATIVEIPQKPRLEPMSASRELLWAVARLAKEAPVIESFLELRAEYEGALLSGNHTTCLQILDSIDQQFGISIWGIENRFAALQRSENGLLAQKNYCASIRQARATGDPLSFIAFYLSERNEEDTNAFRYTRRVQAHLQGAWVPAQIKYYLLWRLTDEVPTDDVGIAQILNYDSDYALIDYYETLITIVQNGLATHDANHFKNFTTVATRLNDSIRDVRLAKMSFIANAKPDPLAAAIVDDLSHQDAILAGQYESALAHAQVASTSDYKAWITSAIGLSEVGREPAPDSSLKGEIIRGFYDAIIKEKQTTEVQNRIYKIRLNHRLCSFPAELDARIWYETSSEAEPMSAAMLSSFMSTPSLTPEILRFLGDSAETYKTVLLERYGKAPSILAEMAILKEHSFAHGPWTEDEGVFLHLQSAYRNGEHSTALELAAQLESAQSKRLRRLAARYTAHCLLALEENREAIEYVVERGLEDRNSFEMMPVTRTARYLEDLDARLEVASKLSTSILLAEASLYDSDRFGSLRDYAYEDFLFAHGVERPSELRPIVTNFKLRDLIYYLRFVCVPEVMENSLVFDSSADVSNERLAVCSLLAGIDPENSDAYEAEAREIARTERIRFAVRHAEQSKIAADLPSLRRWADAALKDDYARYQALSATSISAKPTLTPELLQDILAGATPANLFALPDDEAFMLLAKMVSQVVQSARTIPNSD